MVSLRQGLVTWIIITSVSLRCGLQYEREQASDCALATLRSTNKFIYLPFRSINDLNWLTNLRTNSERVKMKGEDGHKHQS